jgi:hypothetical protein
MFIKHTEDYAGKKAPASLYQAMGEFVGAALKSGQMVEAAGLMPTTHGTRVKLKGGKLTTTDGPFTESKEIVGGYAIIDAKSKTEALELATKFMELHRIHWPEFEGECEMRPLEAEAQPPGARS